MKGSRNKQTKTTRQASLKRSSTRSNTTSPSSLVNLRSFTAFAGQSAGNHVVHAAGKLTRQVGDKKASVPAVHEFVASPELNMLGKVNYLFTKGAPLTVTTTRAFYFGKDGVTGKVKSFAGEDHLKDSDVKFSGAPFAWTGAKITEVYTSGKKVESELAFDKKFVKINRKVTGIETPYTETGTLDVVSPPEFQNRLLDAKKEYANVSADDESVVAMY